MGQIRGILMGRLLRRSIGDARKVRDLTKTRSVIPVDVLILPLQIIHNKIGNRLHLPRPDQPSAG